MVLRILPHSRENLIQPFLLPYCKVTHACQQKVLRTLLFHQTQLIWEKFRLCKIINHMPALNVIPCVAIIAPNSAADDQIHVLDLILDTYKHLFPFSFDRRLQPLFHIGKHSAEIFLKLGDFIFTEALVINIADFFSHFLVILFQ